MSAVIQSVLALAVLLTHVIVIFGFVLVERRQPSATMAWLLALMFLPGVGVVLYLLIGTTRIRAIARRTAASAARVDEVLRKHAVLQKLGDTDKHDDIDERTHTLLRLGRNLSTTPPSRGNRTELLVNAPATYRSMIHAIEAAKHHIHVEFYIIQPDSTGIALRDRLAKRAREGIEVRVLVDAIGSMSLPNDFWEPVIAAGGKAGIFRPVVKTLHRLRRRDRIDFRNHRKIVVVDGEVGFTGGINIGREYLGLNADIGSWRDTHVRIEGPAVLSLQETFLEDWLIATGNLVDGERYFPAPQTSGGCIVQIVDSGPDRTWSPMSHLYTQAIALARERIWITSPYFIPSAVLEGALITASLRGVDVRLLLPAKADYFVVTLASRSYYPDLLDAGVRIYEYGRGFLHAKAMVVDDWVGSVGSANMDLRSFHLNFELNAVVFGRSFTDELARQFLADLEGARVIDPAIDTKLAYHSRLLHAGARLLSPLL
jgi:cardiolipin synthase A/B